MSILFADSFDGYTNLLDRWDPFAGFVGQIDSVGRFGTNGLAGEAQKALGANYGTIIVGFAVRISAGGSLIRFLDASGVQCKVEVLADGTLAVYRGGNEDNLLVRTNKAIRFNSYNYIEFKATIGNTVGAVIIHLNGAPWYELTAVDTQDSDNPFMTAVRVGGWTQIDDVYIADLSGGVNNNFLGDVRVETLFPNGAGTHTDLTPVNSPTNWQAVDEAAANDETDYVSGATPGTKDSYTFANLQATSGVIKAVCPVVRARKDDAGVRSVAALARLAGGTEALSADQVLSTDWTSQQAVLETKPGGGAWTIADVNGAEFGMEITE